MIRPTGVGRTPAEGTALVAELVFDPVWSSAILGGLAVLVLSAAAVAYRRTTRPVSPRLRRTLAALRLGAVAACLLVLLRPAWVHRELRHQKGTLAVLIDRSESMTIQDAWSNLSRAQAAARTYQQCAGPLSRLADKLEIVEYGFSGRLDPLDDVQTKPMGSTTALGDALEEVLRRHRRRHLVAVLVLSDGASNTGSPPQAVASHFRRQGVPIYTVAFGREGPGPGMRDIVAQDIRANRTVFVRNRLSVSGEFVVRGFKGVRLPVELVFDGRVVDTQWMVPRDNEDVLRVDLQHVPTEPGDFKVTVRAPVQPDELLAANNARGTFVRVIKGGLRVLLLSGKARWEARFLRRTLALSPDIDLVAPVTTLGGQVAAEVLKPDAAPDDRYDVYILGSIARDSFTDAQLRVLAKAVEDGAGLLALGGTASFGSGGWAGSPLADVLPVVMSPQDGQIEGDVRLAPTEAGLRHFVLRVAAGRDEDNRQAWQSLEPLQGASRIGRLKPLAQVLAEDASGTPLLVAGLYGKGRVMALAADTTWQWYLQGGRAQQIHKQFWRQMILWLAKHDEPGQKRVWVKVAQTRVPQGARVDVTARAEDPAGNAWPEALLKAEVLLPNGNRWPLALSRRQDYFIGQFWKTDEPGDYAVEVTASAGQGEPIGTAQARFEVYAEDLELSNPKADPALLAAVASISGGRVVRPEQLESFLSQLRQQDLRGEYEQITSTSLWDNYGMLALVVGLVGLEWFLRKRRGLV